jgi:hypothetical protein
MTPERINSLEKQAAAARDELMGPKPVKIGGKYRTYVGAYDPWTGQVVAAHSGVGAPGGGCAEDAPRANSEYLRTVPDSLKRIRDSLIRTAERSNMA